MSISCSFCIHVNPEGSKFCNECGSPLRLKPCGACEAVNDLDTTHCHQCGAELDARSERAHGLAGSVRARESTDSPNGADPLGADVPPLFFDQYLDALRRDLGSGVKPAEEASTHKAQSGSAGGGPLARAIRPEAEKLTELPSDSEALRPVRVTPIVLPERRTASPLLYSLGATLLVIGIMGYGYYQYGLPAPVERWLPGFAASPSTSRASTLFATGSRSITRQADGATSSSTASRPPADSGDTDPAKTASSAARGASAAPASAPDAQGDAESTPAATAPDARRSPESAAVFVADAKRDAESSAAPSRSLNATEPGAASAQTAPAKSAEPPTASARPGAASPVESTSRAQRSSASSSVDATADDRAELVAAGSPKHVARAAPKQSEPRSTAAVRPMTAAPPPVPAAPIGVDTNARSASPLAPVCTKGVAALGLCDPNRQETN